MGYRVTTASYKRNVSVRTTGTWTADSPEIILDEIYSKWVKHQKPDLLVDISKLQADQSIISKYYTSKIFENFGFQSIHLVAIIDNPARKDINVFLERATLFLWIRTYFKSCGKGIWL